MLPPRQSTAHDADVQVKGGWILNGRKRWIGNATFADIVVVWARNSETKEINAFIVRKGTPGFRTTKIENKISLRSVQNANIFLDDCFVGDKDRLEGVNSFKVGCSSCSDLASDCTAGQVAMF